MGGLVGGVSGWMGSGEWMGGGLENEILKKTPSLGFPTVEFVKNRPNFACMSVSMTNLRCSFE